MLSAAERLHFEQAARLREDLRAVQWLARRVGDVAIARKSFTFVYRPPAVVGADVWYLIRRGVIEGALPAPRTAKQRARTEQAIVKWLEQDNHVGQKFAPRPETLALVTSWFRNQRAEFQHTFRPQENISAQEKAATGAHRAS
jgi:excinuclease UvrABC nuclease subunit